jgi:hypothetical protein
MNKGMLIMLKSFGIQIDPAQLENFVEWAKTNLPLAIQQFNEMIERQKRIEEKLDLLTEKKG